MIMSRIRWKWPNIAAEDDTQPNFAEWRRQIVHWKISNRGVGIRTDGELICVNSELLDGSELVHKIGLLFFAQDVAANNPSEKQNCC